MGGPVGLIASLALALAAATSPYQVSDWMPADGPRTTPPAAAVEVPCAKITDGAPKTACEAKVWSDILLAYRQTALTAPAGGRAYRFVLLSSITSTRPTLYRLDVNPTGAGKLTTVQTDDYDAKADRWIHTHIARMADLSADDVAGFEAGLKESQFYGPPPTGPGGCLDGSNNVLEAIEDGRYRWLNEPCGGEADLEKGWRILASVITAPG